MTKNIKITHQNGPKQQPKRGILRGKLDKVDKIQGKWQKELQEQKNQNQSDKIDLAGEKKLLGIKK